MSIVLSSEDIPVVDRVDTIHDAICSGVLPVEIRWDRPAEQIDLTCKLAVTGPVNFNTARSSDNSLWRTARQARSDHEPNIFFVVQGSGTSRISQGDRQVVTRPGDMTVYDTTKPYAVTNVGPTELHYFQVPRSVLALPERALNDVLGARISAENNPLAAAAAPFLAAVGHGDLLDHPRAAELVAAPAIELLRAVVAAHVDDAELGREPLDASLALRVRRYISTNLRDRDMSTDSIAAAHHVSPRHLYNVMARDGVRLHEFIRQQRLEACRRELRDGTRAHLAVATIGAHWGFVDPSHFGRVFKAAYAMTPHEWRSSSGPSQEA